MTSSTNPRRRKAIGAVTWLGVLTLLAAGIAWAYLFRTVREDNATLGIVWRSYRWGRPYEVRADTNRDGMVNFRARVVPGYDFYSHGARPTMAPLWEDRDHDGVFELFMSYQEDGVAELRIDHDGDGVYDQVLVGDAANEWYRRNPAQ